MDYLLSNPAQLKKEKAILMWTTLQLHHYSNGQADSFFIESPVQRNNYRSGDFSTNYYKALLNIGKTDQQKSILSGAIGYQGEVDPGGVLARSKQLQNYYGDSRLLFALQWTQKPKLVTGTYRNRATAQGDSIKLEKRRQVGVRTQLEYILGDVSNFSGENKQRWGWHAYLTYMPSLTNEVGFMVHTYVGRDYLNIRFDDVVFVGELGVYVKFNTR
jgi:hypothetical protein